VIGFQIRARQQSGQSLASIRRSHDAQPSPPHAATGKMPQPGIPEARNEATTGTLRPRQ